MAALARAVTVATTATQLDSTNDVYRGQPALVFYNVSAVTVYVGGSGVTTATGIPVATETWSPGIDLGEGEGVYAIVASGTAEVRVFETGV